MKTLHTALVCLVLAGVAFGQANSQPVLKPRPGSQVEDLPVSTESVPPDAPVVTVTGVCDKQDNAAASDCKTVVTRAQFEKVINSIQPNMPKPQQKQVAGRYVQILMMSQKAHEMGLDHGPEFDEQMYLLRLQLLARLAGEKIQKDAAIVSDADLEAYYKQHSGEFKTVSYDKIYVPKMKQGSAAPAANDPDAQKKREAAEADMKAEADKLRARAAAGEDFTKLQQEAYDFAGMKLTATTSNTHVDKVAKAHMPGSDASIFDLKKGDVSPVISDPQAFMIFKVDELQDQPLAEVHDQVVRTVQMQKQKDVFESLQKSVAQNTTYNDAYFAVPPAPSLRKPGESGPASGPGPAAGSTPASSTPEHK